MASEDARLPAASRELVTNGRGTTTTPFFLKKKIKFGIKFDTKNLLIVYYITSKTTQVVKNTKSMKVVCNKK